MDIALDPSTAVENRLSVMLATLRSQQSGSLAQRIFDHTAIAIVEGRLRPGEALNSVELARRFSTSRTPVREALAELERQGAVIGDPHHRLRVAEAGLPQLKHIYELRAMQVTHQSFSLPNRLERSVADHRRLLRAYEEGDVGTAVAVNRLMIMTGYRALQESRLVQSA